MISYPSSNFSTVFFLVLIFIGMGLLIYHTYEVRLDTIALNEELGTCQIDLDQANTKYAATISETSALQTENSDLMTENSELRGENNKLRTAQGDLNTEISALKDTIAAYNTELEKLSRENSDLRLEIEQLRQQPTSDIESNKAPSEDNQSPFLPTDLETWLKAIMVPLFGEILTIICIAIKALKNLRRKQTIVRNRRNDRDSSGKSRYPNVIDSHFVDR